ncbi:lipopolysaccharide transport periplasmic protein LptA [Neptunicella sp. SCSIO 80796]|uniref:lipopolysaccharide transport periplasmic protein LptA n=1 Tax=Neptunicella plasticusilytica TaxID=3117012 RepID=UPI003A4DCA49
MLNRLLHPALSIKVCCLTLLLTPLCALADKDDFKQPLEVMAENQSADGIEKSGFYRGNVHITQGSLVIDADEVDVIAKDGPGSEVFIARGKPASYQQKADDGSIIKAIANEIRYTLGDRVLTLKENAEFHQKSSMVKAEFIEFDMENEQFKAKGGNDDDGRTITIYQPDTQEKQDGNP